MITASAPGKVVLTGEYAVLVGAPALVLAVNRRVVVMLERTPHRVWRFSSEGFTGRSEHELSVLLGDTALPSADPGRLCQAVLRTLGQSQASVTLPTALDVHIDSSALFEGNHKLGLGSSAAVTVALTGAVLHLAGITAIEVLPTALAAHAAYQGGAGSGLDVAAACFGGLRRFQRSGGAGPDIRSAHLSASLHHRFFWTGASAPTGDFLKRFDQWRNGARPPALDTLCQAAERVADSAPNEVEFMRELRRYTECLARLDHEAQLGVFHGAHREASAAATAFAARGRDVVYKPCGAGGGDLGAAFSLDGTALDELTRHLNSEGLETVPLEKDNHGLKISDR